MKKFSPKAIRSLYLIILLFTFVLFSLISSCSKSNTNIKNLKEEVEISVLVKDAYIGTLESYLEADARVEYSSISKVSFQVSGKIKEIFVQEGDVVNKGQIIASLDKNIYNQQLQQAYQNIVATKANYEQSLYNLKIQKVQAESELERAGILLKQNYENLKLVETLLYQAKKDFERYSNLYNQGVISNQQFENIKIQYQNSLTNYYNARLSLQNAQENLKVAKLKNERISIFENQSKSAYSNYIAAIKNYEIVKENFKYTDLYSPISGVVLEKYQDIGNVVAPSLPVFAIGKLPKVIRASISDVDAKKIKTNTKAIAIFKNKEYPVIINKIYPSSNTIGQVSIKAQFLDPNNDLSHNDYVTLRIITKSTKGIIILRQAIVYSENEAYVFVIQNDRAIQKKIRIIDSSGELAVVEGINEGDKVIVDGQYFVRDGDRVKVVERK